MKKRLHAFIAPLQRATDFGLKTLSLLAVGVCYVFLVLGGAAFMAYRLSPRRG